MTKMSTSPDRGSFSRGTIEKLNSKRDEPRDDYLKMLDTMDEHRKTVEASQEWQENNMEYDLRTTDWILEKVRSSETYAQHLYAAMCNNDFQKRDVWPILSDQRWTCSWRSAGGIIAHMQEKGDYIDWYCSGIRDRDGPDKGFVGEGYVTDEIKEDLLKLGWNILVNDDENI